MKEEHYVIGVDFGTGSVRALLVDAYTGKEIAVSEFEYPRWKKGLFCDPSKNQFRQHPLDYLEGLEYTVQEVVNSVDNKLIGKIRAISVDTTGSTPVAVDKNGIPLALKEEFTDNPNAMFFLWKDHTAMQEAEDINQHAKKFEIDYLQYSGGIYSSEWFWAKLLFALRKDEKIRQACYSWVEHCDWMPFVLTGGKEAKQIKRSVCAAGHKALWAASHGGLPKKEFFLQLDPYLESLELPLFTETYATDTIAGTLCREWAEKLGLSTEVLIGVGALDAHVGAVGGQIEPYYLSKVMGTSTCDMLVVPSTDGFGVVPGICGQVPGSVLPDMLGLEAGQSAFGDVYAWFLQLITDAAGNAIDHTNLEQGVKTGIVKEIEANLLQMLSKEAAQLPLDKHSELAIDWFNGRRTPDANPYVKGAVLNLNLGSNAARIFRALVEATCFGAKRIVDHFIEKNIPMKGIIALGGVARKSDYVMQTMADVLDLPIKVHKSDQTCAMGAAMFASVVAGIYPNVQMAMEKMGHGFEKTYFPETERASVYKKRYSLYNKTGNFIENDLSYSTKK